MLQQKKVEHSLELRKRVGGYWSSWHPIKGKTYDEARSNAKHGRLTEALDLVMDAWIEEHGSAVDVDFRCVSASRVFTFRAGSITDDRVEDWTIR